MTCNLATGKTLKLPLTDKFTSKMAPMIRGASFNKMYSLSSVVIRCELELLRTL
jgi:hypothetical protein